MVLRILGDQQVYGRLALVGGFEDRGLAVDPYPPQLLPIVAVTLGQYRHLRICRNILQSGKPGGRLGFVINCRIEVVAVYREHDGHGVGPAVRPNRSEDCNLG